MCKKTSRKTQAIQKRTKIVTWVPKCTKGSELGKEVHPWRTGPNLKEISTPERAIASWWSDRKTALPGLKGKSVTQRRGKRPRQVSLWKNGPNLKLISKQATTDSFAPKFVWHNPTFGNWKTYFNSKKSNGGKRNPTALQERSWVSTGRARQVSEPKPARLQWVCTHQISLH